MKPAAIRKRQLWLAMALILALSVRGYLWVTETTETEQIVEAVAVKDRTSFRKVAMPTELATPAFIERELYDVAGDLFTVMAPPPPEKPALSPPPPPPEAKVAVQLTAPPPPAPPAIPPLPFTYLGKLGEEGRITVFLSASGRNYVVNVGDTVAQYRVEEIRPPVMTFTYLPLNAKQTMPIGDVN